MIKNLWLATNSIFYKSLKCWARSNEGSKPGILDASRAWSLHAWLNMGWWGSWIDLGFCARSLRENSFVAGWLNGSQACRLEDCSMQSGSSGPAIYCYCAISGLLWRLIKTDCQSGLISRFWLYHKPQQLACQVIIMRWLTKLNTGHSVLRTAIWHCL